MCGRHLAAAGNTDTQSDQLSFSIITSCRSAIASLRYLQSKCAWLSHRSESNVNMPIGSAYGTPYIMVLVIFAISVAISKIIAVDMCSTMTCDVKHWPRSNVNMLINNTHIHTHTHTHTQTHTHTNTQTHTHTLTSHTHTHTHTHTHIDNQSPMNFPNFVGWNI